MSEHAISLPAPGDLEKYERILPGSAARILALAEEQVSDDVWVEKTLAREERLTRAMSLTAIVFATFSSFGTLGAFLFTKFFAN